MKRLSLAFVLALAVVGGGFAIIYGSDPAQAAHVPHQHTNDPIGALNQSTLNHHEVALDVGVSYESSGLFAMVEPTNFESMCEGCGGNHPILYSNCEKCQNGTLAACIDQNGFYASCSCKCGYLGRCIWIRW